MQSAAHIPIRLFSTPTKSWLALSVYTLLLYTTQSWVLQAYLWLFNQVGEAGVSNLLNAFYAAVAILFLILVRPRRPGAWATLALIAAGLVYFFQQLKVPSNRLHFLQYGPLTLLAFDALRFHCHDRFHYVWTLLLVTCIGVGDESAQIFAGRRFDTHDLLLNAMAGLFVLAILGFVLEGEREEDVSRRGAETRRD